MAVAAVAGVRLWRGEIHDAQWPLQPAEVDIRRNTLAAAHGIVLKDATSRQSL